jgi:hypothetical protein
MPEGSDTVLSRRPEAAHVIGGSASQRTCPLADRRRHSRVANRLVPIKVQNNPSAAQVRRRPVPFVVTARLRASTAENRFKNVAQFSRLPGTDFRQCLAYQGTAALMHTSINGANTEHKPWPLYTMVDGVWWGAREPSPSRTARLHPVALANTRRTRQGSPYEEPISPYRCVTASEAVFHGRSSACARPSRGGRR